MTPFSERIHEALDFAAMHHKHQYRKDADIGIPYVSHLFGVAYILAQYDFAEDVIVAGALHDYLEDVVQKKWRKKRRDELETELAARFGNNVQRLVKLVTQQKSDGRGRPIAWHVRGETYRTLLCDPATPNEARAISCADKIHNIESLLMALRRHEGREHAMWGRLKATPAMQIEKFRLLHEGFAACWDHPIVHALGRKIQELEKVVPER